VPRPKLAARSAALSATAFLALWLSTFAALQWSVVRFEPLIVTALTLATLSLATALWCRWDIPSCPPLLVALALLAAAAVTEFLPFFSHAAAADQRLLAHVMAGTAVLAAVAVGSARRLGPAIAAGIAAIGVIAWTVLAIAVSPSPRIDVWVTLQQAADGVGRGENPYTMTWLDSPGIQDAFTYLPGTAMLLAPGRWLAGDVRWSLLVALLVGLTCLAALGSPRPRGSDLGGWSWGSAGSLIAVTLLALAPGSVIQAEQAWTEPLLFACLAGWALLIRRGHPWWAVVPLALGCASKQHLLVLLPVLACWYGFGWLRAVASGALAGLFMSPWVAADPAAFWHDTVTLLAGFRPLPFANTWFIAAMREWHWLPPFWLTGLVAGGTLAVTCVVVWRRRPSLAHLLWWLALVLFVANLVNKQAFYNQFWLVGSLVALGLAAADANSRSINCATPSLSLSGTTEST
jgi:hypothetical protein